MKHYSKKDWRVLLLVWIAILLPLAFGFIAIHIQTEAALVISGWISLSVALLLIIALSTLSFPLYYEIETTGLRIRSGLLRQEIPLASIQAVFPTRNPLVAAAWSLDRLQVNYQLGKHSLCALIAPRDTNSFLYELAQHDSNLEIKSNALMRRQSL
ncbi:MAG: PH domain-containing protein [Ktedonobacteraceae bacterium]|nr:PH domain-containing protein [Ktedonobacteraceae bacterium]